MMNSQNKQTQNVVVKKDWTSSFEREWWISRLPFTGPDFEIYRGRPISKVVSSEEFEVNNKFELLWSEDVVVVRPVEEVVEPIQSRVLQQSVVKHRCVEGFCPEEAICVWCERCLNHNNPKKCCGFDICRTKFANWTVVKTKKKRSLLPYRRRFTPVKRSLMRKLAATLEGVAQSLFGVDFNFKPSEIKHILEIPALTGFIESLKSVNDKIPWTMVIKEVLFFGLHLTRGGFTPANLAICAAHFCSNIGMDSMLSCFKSRVAAAQSGVTSAVQVIALAVSGVISIASLWLFNKVPRECNVDQFINRFSKLGSCLTSAGKIYTVTEGMTMAIMDFIQKTVFGLSTGDLKEFEMIDKFCDEVQELNTPDLSKKCAEDLNGVIRQKVTGWLIQADNIKKTLDAMRLPSVASQRFTSTYLFLIKVRDMLDMNPVGTQTSRIAPLVVHIYGTTGVGKTSALDFLNARLLVELGSKSVKDLDNKVYQRDPGVEFFDGFNNGTEIVICDDFGAVADTPSRPSVEAIQAIRMGNTAPYKPPMADLSGKANAIFAAKVIIWTSNRAKFDFPSLTNPEAVYNRVHLRFMQRPAPGYVKVVNIDGKDYETLDAEKVDEEAEHDETVRQRCLMFDQESTRGTLNPGTNRYTLIKEGLTFDEMSEICVQALRRKLEKGKEYKDYRQKYFEDLIKAQPQASRTDEDVCREFGINEHQYNDFLIRYYYPFLMYRTDKDLVEPAEYLAKLVSEGLGVESLVREKRDDAVPSLIDVGWKELLFYRRQGLVLPIKPVFHRVPTMIERACGAMHHIDVFQTLNAFGFSPVWNKELFTQQQYEVLQPYFTTGCFMCSAGDVNEVVDFFHDLWSVHYQTSGEMSPQALVDMVMERNLNFFPCDCINHDAEVDFFSRLTESAKEGCQWWAGKLLTKVCQAFDWWPEMTAILGIVLGVAGMYVIRTVTRYILKQLWKGVCAVGSYIGNSVASLGAKTASFFTINERNAEVEAYPNAQPTVKPVTVVEAVYSTGMKEKPMTTVEGPYATGVVSKPASTVEGPYSTGVTAKPVSKVEGAAESLSDQNAYEIRGAVAKNMYQILTTDDGAYWPIGTMTILRGRVGVTNRHVFEAMRSQVRLVKHIGGPLIFDMKKSDLNFAFVPDETPVYGSRDMGLVELPLNIPIHSDLTKHIMESGDFSRHERLARAALVGYSPDFPGVLSVRETDDAKAVDNAEMALDTGKETRIVRRFYTYALETSRGDCGSVLIAVDPRLNRKICGVHFAGLNAGNGHTAASAVLSRGYIDEALKHLTLRWNHSWFNGAVKGVTQISTSVEGGTMAYSGRVMAGVGVEGTVDKPVHQAKTTNIRKSPVFDVCGPVFRQPAYLTRTTNRQGETVDPMPLAMKKVAMPSVLMPEDLAVAEKRVREMICNGDITNARTLSFDEAIAGKEGNDLYPSINRSTSPGYGWDKSGKGKTAFLGEGEYVISPEVSKEYENVLTGLLQGERAGKLWTDTLKDEVRPIEKAEAGKTRLFSAGEMILTILLRQYFMGFTAHMAHNKISMESCVGVNPYGYDWHAIALKLKKHGSRVVAGDFANYDGTLPADGLWSVLNVVNAFYAQQGDQELENNKIREMLWMEIVNSVHVNGGDVYSWTHSQPSGCPFTSVLNSVFHSIAVRTAYMVAAKKHAPEMATMSHFEKYVSHVNYGDDDVTNVAEEASWFSQIAMADAYATFGMTYTDELKTGEMVEFRTLEEVQFLKRAFVFDKDQCRYTAPLDIKTICEMPCWNKTKGDAYELSALVVEDAAYELSIHPKSVWEQHITMLEKAALILRKKVPSLYLPTYDELRFIDFTKYVTTKPRDRGTGMMAESSGAANPAEVLDGPSPLASLQEVGSLFSDTDECVPTLTSKDQLIQPNVAMTESLWQTFKRLAEQVNNKPTMCKDSAMWKAPEVLEHYTVVDLCKPCEFHSFRRTSKIMSGTGQAGEGPDFAGDANTEEQHEIVEFQYDGEVEPAPREPVPMETIVATSGSDTLIADISGVLRRPYHIKDVVWKATDAVGTQLLTLDLPNEWLTKPMIKEKLAGFRYLRCNLVVELQINSQPMNAGALLTVFTPASKMLQAPPSSVAHFGGLTGYPNVVFRCGESSAVRMTIPFFPLVSHFDLARGYGTMGEVVVHVFSQLTGTPDVDGAVFVWAENISVDMPTGVPLSGIAQAGGAEERKRPGNVETTARVLKGAADKLSGIPVIGSFATTASTVLGAAGSVASWFGWSKPADPEFVTTVTPLYARHAANFNGDVKTKMLALDAKNTTNVATSVFNTNEDEMSIAAIASKSTYADRFKFEAAQPQGTLLFSWPVDPTSCLKATQTVTINEEPVELVERAETNLSYASSFGLWWRGSLDMDFKFVKNNFFSGRVKFIYAPGATEATDFSTIDLNKCYSRVVDLRSTSDVSINIPYNYHQLWKEVQLVGVNANKLNKCYSNPQGMLYAVALNALRAPPTVAQSIDCLVYVSAGEDFELAVPNLNPALNIWTEAAYVVPPTYSGRAQAGEPLFTTPQKQTVDIEASSSGEGFRSLRQFLKRYTRDLSNVATGTTLLPTLMFGGKYTKEGNVAKEFDLFTRVGALYRFQCGSMRTMFVNVSGVHRLAASSVPVDSNYVSAYTHGFAVCPTTILESTPEFTTPMYQKYPAFLTDVGSPTPNQPETAPLNAFQELPYNRGTALQLEPALAAEDKLFRAIGEDFSFGYMIGVPKTFWAVEP
jgi:hypothetical protein